MFQAEELLRFLPCCHFIVIGGLQIITSLKEISNANTNPSIQICLFEEEMKPRVEGFL